MPNNSLLVSIAKELSNGNAVIIGFGTVFVGLICIVILCSIVGAICKKAIKETKEEAPAVQNTTAGRDENRQEILAAVTAVCAENMGKDISAVRVVSFKKVN